MLISMSNVIYVLATGNHEMGFSVLSKFPDLIAMCALFCIRFFTYFLLLSFLVKGSAIFLFRFLMYYIRAHEYICIRVGAYLPFFIKNNNNILNSFRIIIAKKCFLLDGSLSKECCLFVATESIDQ